MCRIGTIIMATCGHARQAGWRDDMVKQQRGAQIVKCQKAATRSHGTNTDDFCGRITVHTGPGLDSPDPLPDRCKFCTLHASNIGVGDEVQDGLRRYNMALLSEADRAEVLAEMGRLFRAALDDAVAAYGSDGTKEARALRALDREQKRASGRVQTLCSEKQLAPYRELGFGGGV